MKVALFSTQDFERQFFLPANKKARHELRLRVVVIAVPWYLTPPKIAEAMSEEEAAVPLRVRNVLGFSRRRSSRKPA